MRRKYQIFEDANWINTPEFRQAKDEANQFYVDNPSAAEELYTKQLDPLPKTLPLVRASLQEQTDDLRKMLLMLSFVDMIAPDFLQRCW